MQEEQYSPVPRLSRSKGASLKPNRHSARRSMTANSLLQKCLHTTRINQKECGRRRIQRADLLDGQRPLADTDGNLAVSFPDGRVRF